MTTASGALAPVVDALVREPVADWCVSELQAQITEVAPQAERLLGWLSMASGQLQARTGGMVPTPEGGKRTVSGWLAEQRRETPQVVGAQLKTSTLLRSLPLVSAAVLDGVLTQGQAVVLSRLVGPFDQEALAGAEPHLIEVAAPRNPAELAAYVQHLIATHCEPALDDEAQGAAGRRFLQTGRDGGLLRGRFAVPAEDGEALLTALEPLARRDGLSDNRTAGQRRADALVELAEQVLRHGDLPASGSRRPQLDYVLPADWAAKQAERASCPTCSSCPEHRLPSLADTVTASVPGMGGVPAEHACAVAAWTGPQTRGRIEAMLCEARITRVLLNTLGQVTGMEQLTEHVTKAQRRALAARDGGCAVRGCTRPPAMCDAHHLTHRADGGETSMANLVHCEYDRPENDASRHRPSPDVTREGPERPGCVGAPGRRACAAAAPPSATGRCGGSCLPEVRLELLPGNRRLAGRSHVGAPLRRPGCRPSPPRARGCARGPRRR